MITWEKVFSFLYETANNKDHIMPSYIFYIYIHIFTFSILSEIWNQTWLKRQKNKMI